MDWVVEVRAELIHTDGIEINGENTTHIFIKIPTEQAKNTPGVSVYTWTSWLREGWSVWGCLQERGPETSRGGGVGESGPAAHLFFGAWVVRGGVTGRPEFTPPYWYLAFFSDGFRIWEEGRWGEEYNKRIYIRIRARVQQTLSSLPERST